MSWRVIYDAVHARQGFEDLLATRPAIARRWLSSVAQRLAASQARILALLGGSLNPGRDAPVARPSLKKVLKELERDGLIRIRYDTIEVPDTARLAARA